MKTETDFLDRHARKLFFIGVVAFTLAIILSAIGCTVTPRNVKDTQPSFDGSQFNSGFIGFTNVYVNKVEGKYGVLTSHAYDRYNALIDKYGDRFTPELKRGDGIVPSALHDVWYIDLQHLVYFETMNRWRKQEAAK